MTTPQPGALYAYARVSTDAQDLTRQRHGLAQAGYPPPVVERLGGDVDRPALRSLVHQLLPEDRLGVLHVDRFARDVRQGLDLLDLIRAQKAELHIVQAGLILRPEMDDHSAQTMFEILLVLAGAELRTIRKRVRDAADAGRKGGRPPALSAEQQRLAVAWYRDDSWAPSRIAAALGCSEATARRVVRRAGLASYDRGAGGPGL